MDDEKDMWDCNFFFFCGEEGGGGLSLWSSSAMAQASEKASKRVCRDELRRQTDDDTMFYAPDGKVRYVLQYLLTKLLRTCGVG